MVDNIRLENDSVGGLLVEFAIPSIISMLSAAFYNFVDQIFIGWRVGYLGNAATNVAAPIMSLAFAIALLIGIGGSASYSIELGRKDYEKAGFCVSDAIKSGIILSFIYVIVIEWNLESMLKGFGATMEIMPFASVYVKITALGIPFIILVNILSSLIRADGSPKYAMRTVILGGVINIILDPIFMFIFGMGIEGAAWATVIAQLISFLYGINYIRNFKVAGSGNVFTRFDLLRAIRSSFYGANVSINQIAMTFVQVVMNKSLVYYGAMSIYGSNIPLSSFGIVAKIHFLLNAVIIGIAQGAQPISGYNFGAGNYDRVKRTYFLEVKFTVFFATVAFLIFQIFPERIIGIFGSGNKLYFDFAVMVLRVYLSTILFNGIFLVTTNFFSAIGMPKKGVYLVVLKQIVFLIPAILILPGLFGLNGMLYTAPVADVLSFIVVLILIKRQFENFK